MDTQGHKKTRKVRNNGVSRSRQYYGPSKKYEYNGHTYDAYGEVRLAKIFTEQMDPPVAFTPHVRERCADLDGEFDYEVDFRTEREVKFPGMGFGARYFEVKGFLSRKFIRKMRALENKTGHKGWIMLPGHLNFIEKPGGTEWTREDFISFEPPNFGKNSDSDAIEELRKLLIKERISFKESAEFECIAWKGEELIRFTFVGHFYFPEPIKLFGIPHPVQILRVVDELTKNEIIAMESLTASAEVNGYLTLKTHVYTWKKEGLVKRGRHRPVRSIPGPIMESHNGSSREKKEQTEKGCGKEKCKKRRSGSKNGSKNSRGTPTTIS